MTLIPRARCPLKYIILYTEYIIMMPTRRVLFGVWSQLDCWRAVMAVSTYTTIVVLFTPNSAHPSSDYNNYLDQSSELYNINIILLCVGNCAIILDIAAVEAIHAIIHATRSSCLDSRAIIISPLQAPAQNNYYIKYWSVPYWNALIAEARWVCE